MVEAHQWFSAICDHDSTARSCHNLCLSLSSPRFPIPNTLPGPAEEQSGGAREDDQTAKRGATVRRSQAGFIEKVTAESDPEGDHYSEGIYFPTDMPGLALGVEGRTFEQCGHKLRNRRELSRTAYLASHEIFVTFIGPHPLNHPFLWNFLGRFAKTKQQTVHPVGRIQKLQTFMSELRCIPEWHKPPVLQHSVQPLVPRRGCVWRRCLHIHPSCLTGRVKALAPQALAAGGPGLCLVLRGRSPGLDSRSHQVKQVCGSQHTLPSKKPLQPLGGRHGSALPP